MAGDVLMTNLKDPTLRYQKLGSAEFEIGKFIDLIWHFTKRFATF